MSLIYYSIYKNEFKSILSLFHLEFNKFNYTTAQLLDSILLYITLKFL